MLYVSDHLISGMYCVTDTDDNVTEKWSGDDLIKIVRKLKVNILGVSNENGKWRIRIVNNIEAREGARAQHKGIDLDTLSRAEQDNIVYPLFKHIADTANEITGRSFNTADVELMDGWDCVGIHYNTNGLSQDFYSNDCMDFESSEKLKFNIGVDLSGKGIGTKYKFPKSKLLTIVNNDMIHIDIPKSDYMLGVHIATTVLKTLLN